jgi:hypothetical protein
MIRRGGRRKWKLENNDDMSKGSWCCIQQNHAEVDGKWKLCVYEDTENDSK